MREKASHELIEIDAGHGGERMPVYLYLPKTFEPPHHAVIWFTHGGAFGNRAPNDSHADFDLQYLDFLPRARHALIVPIWWNSYERHTVPNRSNVESATKLRKEVGRLLDYIAERDDLGSTALVGLSYGAGYVSPLFLAVEDRFEAAVMLSGSIPERPPRSPLVDPLNYVPRVTAPLLHISGRYDQRIPNRIRELTFSRWGTPELHKRYVTYDAGHWPFPPKSTGPRCNRLAGAVSGSTLAARPLLAGFDAEPLSGFPKRE